MIFSSNSISSRGRSALRKAWTVTETSFGSVHSGNTVATICGMQVSQRPANMSTASSSHLVDQGTTVDVVRLKDLSPKIRLTPLDEVPRLLLEHRVLIGDRNKLVITEALCVRNVGEVWIPLLAEFTDDQRLVKVVLLQERLGVAIAVDVDLGQGVVHGRILRAGLHPSFQPGEDQLEPVSLLDFVNQFVNGEVSRDGSQEALDRSFVAVYIQQTTDNLRSPDGVHPLNVNFDELGQAVLV